MLEYAYIKGNKIPVHVSSVPNGKECNCICPNCGEALIAKNKCVDMTNHFSHVGGNETRECRMTQLHLLAQHHFLETPFITLPRVGFQYKGEELYRGQTSTRIINAQLEKSLNDGKWKADVMLDTEVGQIAIEIMVTHATEREKVDYYRNEKIPTIEFDLSKLRTIELRKALDILGNNNAPSEWLHPWCKIELINEHEELLKKRRVEFEKAEKLKSDRILKNKRKNARKHARQMLRTKAFTLPSITKTFCANYRDKQYEKLVTIKPKKDCLFDEVREVYTCNDYLLFKGVIKEHHLWIVYLLTDEPHHDIFSLEGSIVARYPASTNRQQSEWEWLHHPSIEKAIKASEDKFNTYCYFEYQRQTKTEELAKELSTLASEYIMFENKYFKAQYHLWKSWLIKKGIFIPSEWKQNPSIPILFKKDNFNPLPYWVFNSWHIYICCRLAELVDQYREGEYNSLGVLGNHFIKEVGVHERYFSIISEVTYRYIDEELRSILFCTELMEAILKPFVDIGVILLRDGEFLRRGSLLNAATKGC
ncbi:hypothetical protein RUL20_002028 [Vibrio parahaemolyticus]|nr:hypothetical protein [Vibrio parahaemolyticus]